MTATAKLLGFERALRELPSPGGGGYHPSILGVANRGVRAGIAPDDIVRAIHEHTPPGGRRVSVREIEQAVEKAVRETKGSAPWRPYQVRTTPHGSFNAEAFFDRLQCEARGITEADIRAASPITIEGPPEEEATTLLRHLYEPDEIVFIGDRYGTEVAPVSTWIAGFRAGDPVPPHIIPNPVTGQPELTKDGKPSYRADACIGSFRFATVEFDNRSRDEQLRFWWSINLPVVALIDTGGKSLHGWIHIDGVKDTESWDREVEQGLFARYMVPLGCDSACRNEARLSRLPGHLRTETNKWQRILYLAPKGRRIGQ